MQAVRMEESIVGSPLCCINLRGSLPNSRLNSHSFEWKKSHLSNFREVRVCTSKRFMMFNVLKESQAKEPSLIRPGICLTASPLLAITLNTILNCQPAYADFKPNTLREAGVLAEVTSSTAPSVESILVKQLARRFREMSDEELADIIQQLLKASRSSLSSLDPSGESNITENILMNKNNMPDETPNRLTEETRLPTVLKAKDRSEKANKFMDMFKWGSDPQDKERDPPTNRKLSNLPADQQADEKKVELVEKTGEGVANQTTDTEMEGNSQAKDNTLIEKIPQIGQNYKGQRKRGSGSEAFAESLPGLDAEKATEMGKVVLPDSKTGPLSELPAPEPKTTNDESDENLTRVLWDEWNKRLGQEREKEDSDSSLTSSIQFDIGDLWQSVQNFIRILVIRIRPFTDWAFGLDFGKYKLLIVVAIWPVCLVLAFLLGRSHAASRKMSSGRVSRNEVGDDRFNRGTSKFTSRSRSPSRRTSLGRIPRSNEFEENVEMDLKSRGKRASLGTRRYPKEGESPVNGSQAQTEPWWKWNFGEKSFVGTIKSSAQSISETTDSSGSPVSITGGKSAPKSKFLNFGFMSNSTNELTSQRRGEPDVEETISSLVEQSTGQKDSEEEFVKNPLLDRALTDIHRDVEDGGLQPEGIQSHAGMTTVLLTPKMAYVNVDATNDQELKLSMLEKPTGTSIEAPHLDLRSVMTSPEVSPSGFNADKGNKLEIHETSKNQNQVSHELPANDPWKENTPRMMWSEDSQNYNSLGDRTAPQAHSDGSSRNVEGQSTIQSETKSDSFLHDRVLWVRDTDGVYIQQSLGKSENGSSNLGSSSSSTQDMHDSSSKERNMKTLESRDLLNTSASKDSIDGSRKRFDYRKLSIDPRDSQIFL